MTGETLGGVGGVDPFARMGCAGGEDEVEQPADVGAVFVAAEGLLEVDVVVVSRAEAVLGQVAGRVSSQTMRVTVRSVSPVWWTMSRMRVWGWWAMQASTRLWVVKNAQVAMARLHGTRVPKQISQIG